MLNGEGKNFFYCDAQRVDRTNMLLPRMRALKKTMRGNRLCLVNEIVVRNHNVLYEPFVGRENAEVI